MWITVVTLLIFDWLDHKIFLKLKFDSFSSIFHRRKKRIDISCSTRTWRQLFLDSMLLYYLIYNFLNLHSSLLKTICLIKMIHFLLIFESIKQFDHLQYLKVVLHPRVTIHWIKISWKKEIHDLFEDDHSIDNPDYIKLYNQHIDHVIKIAEKSAILSRFNRQSWRFLPIFFSSFTVNIQKAFFFIE